METVTESTNPTAALSRPHKVKKKDLSEIRKEAVLSRWDSVKQEQEKWLDPFRKLPVERAMAYLEDLRKIAELAGRIMNDRINSTESPLRCAGVRCGKNLSGMMPNGRPKWIAQVVVKDSRHPEIMHSLFFCSELCKNTWVRDGSGARGTDGK